MYVYREMLAKRHNVTPDTISRIVLEMENTGDYPRAVKFCGRKEINEEDFEDYLTRRKRRKRK